MQGFRVVLAGLLIVLLPVMAILRLLLRANPNYRKRSIWTGAPIITMPLNAQVERQLGFDTKTIVRTTYFITDKFDVDISAKARNNRVMISLLSYAIFIWICISADRVHAYADGGLLPAKRRSCFNPLELFFYKILKLKLFIWTYGGDVRSRQKTQALGEPNCCTDCTSIKAACICDDALAAENYRRVAQVATAVFAMGDMIEYCPNSHRDLFFWPIDLDRDQGKHYEPSYPEFTKAKPLRIVHAPNHRQFKGTQYLEAAVKELIAEGLAIDLVLVEKIANDQALAIYRSADVIFDQCLIGFHGYFAIEAMALGKPVMCYIRHPEKYLLNPTQCPILNTHRDELKNSLRRLASKDRELLPNIGRQSRAYVEQHYSLEAFASRLKGCYDMLGVNVTN